MTRIDFYILQANTEHERLHFAAKLCEKAFKQELRVMLLTENEETARLTSEQLWQFKPESFVPHTFAALADAQTPIVISSGEDDINHHGLLINLSLTVPSMFSRFQRLAEVVVQSPATLTATRRHFAYYKARGYPVNTHNL